VLVELAVVELEVMVEVQELQEQLILVAVRRGFSTPGSTPSANGGSGGWNYYHTDIETK
jgi:hypothetical protein